MKIKIELDVYSGRPNPEWIIEGDEADSINNMLQDLPVLKTPGPTDGLGYRGFILHIERESIHLYSGMIWKDENTNVIRADQHHVEQVCFEMARKKGFGKILDTFGIR